MASGKIMIVDDDRNICELLRLYIEKEGFETAIANDGKAAVQMFDSVNPDLMLLDIMLPGEDGISILRRLRSLPDTAALPVILLTAKNTEYDKVIGLDSGADDYIAKPFGVLELTARVKSQLRRYMQLGGGAIRKDVLSIGGIELDDRSKEVSLDGEKISLTRTEYDRCAALLGQALT